MCVASLSAKMYRTSYQDRCTFTSRIQEPGSQVKHDTLEEVIAALKTFFLTYYSLC
jgi:hypothetical protein